MHVLGRLAAVLALILTTVVPAGAWNTKTKEDTKGIADWRSIYIIPPFPNEQDKRTLHEAGAKDVGENEHAQLAYLALGRLGLMTALATGNLPDVVDLNASVFRHQALAQHGTFGPDTTDRLEHRSLPPIAQFAGLPDFSYTLIDWINKNAHCPALPKSANHVDKCHAFAGWMGALNSSHFGTLASRTYRYLHKIALKQAQRAQEMRTRLHDAKALEAYRDHVREAEWMALAYEGVAQHFLQDRWSSGHMWERWNGDDWPSIAYPNNMFGNLEVGMAAGLIHGVESTLHGLPTSLLPKTLWPDPMSSPVLYGYTERAKKKAEENGEEPEEQRIPVGFHGVGSLAQRLGSTRQWILTRAEPVSFRHRDDETTDKDIGGVGDHRAEGLFTSIFPGKRLGFSNRVTIDVSEQREQLMACMMAGWSEVVQAFGRNADGTYGASSLPMTRTISFESLDHDCFDMYTTNEAIYQGWDLGTDGMIAKAGGFVLRNLLRLQGAKKFLPANRQGWVAVTARIRLWRASVAGGLQLASGKLGNFGRALAGHEYNGVANYWPPENLDDLPEKDAKYWQDKQALFGFFSKANAEYWCRRMPDILEELRSGTDMRRAAACEYLASWAYEGTDPAYHGPQAERRPADAPPVLCRALGVDLPQSRAPRHLPPGYVIEPGLRGEPSRPLASIQAWCRRAPVLYLVADPALRDRDVVGVIEGAGVFVTLKGADLGSERGHIWVGCGDGEERQELVVRKWADDRIEVRPTPLIEPGEHSVCLQRADGYESLGHYVLEYRLAPPKVTIVEIWSGGETWYRQPGNVDRPLAGGTYRLVVEFNQPMDTEVPAIIAVQGPGQVTLSEGKWVNERRWTVTLNVPRDPDAFIAARGTHRLRILALSLGGKRLDADPATPGAQPDERFRFRVGGELPAEFVGCYRGVWDDGSALEIGKDGHVLAAVDNGRRRFPLVVTEVGDRRLVLRHYFDLASFREYYAPPRTFGAIGPLASLDEQENFEGMACKIRPDEPDIFCEYESPPVSGHTEEHCETLYVTSCTADGKCTQVPDRFCQSVWVEDQPGPKVYGINLSSSYLQWALKLRTSNKPNTPRLLQVDLDQNKNVQVINSPDGGLFVAREAFAGLVEGLEMRPTLYDKTLIGMKPTHLEKKRAPMEQLDDLMWGRVGELSDRPPRIEKLEVLDENGKVLSDVIGNDSLFELRARGTSHCPGLVESVPVYVRLPGAEGRSRIVLKETGPDSGIYEGPDVPLFVSLPEKMKTGHVMIVVDNEITARTGGIGVPGATGGPQADQAVRQASKGVALSLRVVPSKAAAKKAVKPEKPSVSWRSYALEISRPPGRRLPDIYVVQTRYEEYRNHARLVRLRHDVSLARGSRDQVALWSVRWESGRTIEDVNAAGSDLANLRKRAKALRKNGFPLEHLPQRLADAIGGKVQPLKTDWGPAGAKRPAKAAPAKAGRPAPKKAAKAIFTYNGPSYRARSRARMQAGGRTTTQEWLVYVMPGRTRMEMKTGPNGIALNTGPMITISREDLGVRWTLFERSRTFMESPYTPQMTRTLEGTEKQGGKVLKRYHFTIKDRLGAKVTGSMWTDERGIPVRMIMRTKMPDGTVQETETITDNIQVESLDESLFELPKDYRPMGYGSPR